MREDAGPPQQGPTSPDRDNPFSAPAAASLDRPDGAAAMTTVRTGGWATHVTMGALLVVALAAVTSVLMNLRLYVMAREIAEYGTVSEATWRVTARLTEYTDYTFAVLYYLCAIPFLTWLHRARANVDALQIGGLRHSRAATVWSWFVPVLNLWRPYQVTAEIWLASDPEADPRRTYVDATGARPTPVILWWGLYLLPILITAGTRLVVGSAQDPDNLPATQLSSALYSAVHIPAAALTIELIRKLDRRQATAAQRLMEAAPPPSAAQPYGSPVPLDPSINELPDAPYDESVGEHLRRKRRRQRRR